MQQASAELAKASLRLFQKEMSPEYDQVSRLLLANLTGQEATIGQLALQHDNDCANASLLWAFTRLLPKATHIPREGWKFEVDDPVVARAIQSHVVWMPETSGGWHVKPDDNDAQRRKRFEEATTYGNRPYFVLGSGGEGAKTTWILGCVGKDDNRDLEFNPYTWMDAAVKERQDKAFFFKPGWRARRILRNHVEVERSEFPTPSEMRQMFDPESSKLKIDETSPRSSQIPNRRFNDLRQLDKATDYLLGVLGVTTRLERIAAELNIASSLERLYEKYTFPEPSQI